MPISFYYIMGRYNQQIIIDFSLLFFSIFPTNKLKGKIIFGEKFP